MEYPRMVKQLQAIIDRAHNGTKRVRTMDVEAVKDALDYLDEKVPNDQRPIGFQIK